MNSLQKQELTCLRPGDSLALAWVLLLVMETRYNFWGAAGLARLQFSKSKAQQELPLPLRLLGGRGFQPRTQLGGHTEPAEGTAPTAEELVLHQLTTRSSSTRSSISSASRAWCSTRKRFPQKITLQITSNQIKQHHVGMSLLAEFKAAQLPSEGCAQRSASRGSAECFSLAACALPCRSTGVATSSCVV